MPKPRPEGLPRSRHAYEAVIVEIRHKIREAKEKGIPQKKIAEVCKLSETGFTQRLRGEESRFEVEDFGAIADFFNAPRGWPFISWLLAEQMESALKNKTRKG